MIDNDPQWISASLSRSEKGHFASWKDATSFLEMAPSSFANFLCNKVSRKGTYRLPPDDFKSTILSLLRGISPENPNNSKLDEFCRLYSKPLLRYLIISKKVLESDAEELLQDFWIAKLFDPNGLNLVEQYLERLRSDPHFRFRSYLCRSVHNFYLDRMRKYNRNPVRSLGDFAIDEGKSMLDPPSPGSEPDLFDKLWANHLLKKTIESVKDEINSKGQTKLWELFELLYLQPLATGGSSPSYAEITNKLGYETPKQAANAMQTVSRKFQRIFTEIVREFLPDSSSQSDLEQTIKTEVAELSRILSTPGGFEPFADYQMNVTDYSMIASSFDKSLAFRFPTDLVKLNCEVDTDFQLLWNQILDSAWHELVEIQSDDRTGTQSVQSQLFSEHPNIEWLTAIRDTAKKGGQLHAEAPYRKAFLADSLPTEINAVLYLLSTAALHLRHNRYSSRDPHSTFRARITRILQFSWIDKKSRTLLSEWYSALSESPLG